MAKIDDVLTEIRMINAKLYGEAGFEGDIPQMKQTLRETCDAVTRNTQNIAVMENKVKNVSKRNKKEVGASGGIGAIIGVVVASVIDYFLRKG